MVAEVISYEIAIRRMPLDLIDDKSTLVQVMAWCHQATSHYLSQCWPRSLSPYGVTRPQWVKRIFFIETFVFLTEISLKLVPLNPVMWLVLVRESEWFGTKQASSHCLNQWWHSPLIPLCVNKLPQWVKKWQCLGSNYKSVWADFMSLIFVCSKLRRGDPIAASIYSGEDIQIYKSE